MTDKPKTNPENTQDPHSAESVSKLLALQIRLGYIFNDEAILKTSLTHSSGAKHGLASNERLEFLGDAVLGLTVCDLVFQKYPEFREGEMTRIKSVVVSRKMCAEMADELQLGEALILGRGISSQAAMPRSLLANALESVIAAVYIDGGRKAAIALIRRLVSSKIEAVVAAERGINHKSLLQHYTQKRFGKTPTYVLQDVKGPEHGKSFKTAAKIGNEVFDAAWGTNKKDAEQDAAEIALAELKKREKEEKQALPAGQTTQENATKKKKKVRKKKASSQVAKKKVGKKKSVEKKPVKKKTVTKKPVKKKTVTKKPVKKKTVTKKPVKKKTVTKKPVKKKTVTKKPVKKKTVTKKPVKKKTVTKKPVKKKTVTKKPVKKKAVTKKPVKKKAVVKKSLKKKVKKKTVKKKVVKKTTQKK